ncbi:hypothetical protein NMY22_g13830 [Coprinellus aureogranulatus]|nr:hypothetical protein NMY22_g13830 [Coprinellus aureogranulatus]
MFRADLSFPPHPTAHFPVYLCASTCTKVSSFVQKAGYLVNGRIPNMILDGWSSANTSFCVEREAVAGTVGLRRGMGSAASHVEFSLPEATAETYERSSETLSLRSWDASSVEPGAALYLESLPLTCSALPCGKGAHSPGVGSPGRRLNFQELPTLMEICGQAAARAGGQQLMMASSLPYRCIHRDLSCDFHATEATGSYRLRLTSRERLDAVVGLVGDLLSGSEGYRKEHPYCSVALVTLRECDVIIFTPPRPSHCIASELTLYLIWDLVPVKRSSTSLHSLASGTSIPVEMVMEIFHHYLMLVSGRKRRHFPSASRLFRKEAGRTTLAITPSADYPNGYTEADFVVPFSLLSKFRDSVSSMGVFSSDFGVHFGNIGTVVIFAVQPQVYGDTITEVLNMLDVEHLKVYAESTPSAFFVPFLATVPPSTPNLTSLALKFHDFERGPEMAYRVQATVLTAKMGWDEDELDAKADLEWHITYPHEASECGTPYCEQSCPICTGDIAQVNRNRPWSNVVALRNILNAFGTIQDLKIYVSKKYFEDKPPNRVDRLADAHLTFLSTGLRSYVYERLERKKNTIAGEKCLVRKTDRWTRENTWQVRSSAVDEDDSDDEGNME